MAEGITSEPRQRALHRKQQLRDAQKRASAKAQNTPPSTSTPHEGIVLPTTSTVLGGAIASIVTSMAGGESQATAQPAQTAIAEHVQGEKTYPAGETNRTHIPTPLDIVTYEANTSEHQDAQREIDKQAKLLKYDINNQITPHHERSLNVAKKHQDLITRVATEYGITPEIALSLMMVENGGGEFEVNKASGAKGMWQLKKGAAEDMGLKVNDDPNEIDPIKDERLDPLKASNAALGYLRRQIDYFGDYRWGIASYHTGVTNICDYVYQWAKAHNKHQALPKPNVENGVTPGEISTVADFIRMNRLSPHKVLSDPSVVYYVLGTKYLDNDSLIYNYAVAAARKLLDEEGIVASRKVMLNIPIATPRYSGPRTDKAIV